MDRIYNGVHDAPRSLSGRHWLVTGSEKSVQVLVPAVGQVVLQIDFHLSSFDRVFSKEIFHPDLPFLCVAAAPIEGLPEVGPERCMFESNFPPDKMSFSYNVMYNAFKRLSQSYSTTERAAMFHDTAVRVYRIDV